MSIAKSGSFKFAKSSPTRTALSGTGSSDTGSGSALRLPISASDVLESRYTGKAALRDEMLHGNPVLMRTLEALGMVGPFTMTNPWEMSDPQGHSTINAGGYAAIPFGDRYPPLAEFVSAYARDDRSLGLPQQSASPWRAALETNLIALVSQFWAQHADSKVFFSNSGTEAIEAAIKFVKAARPKARHLINFYGAYHGKTFGSLALTPNPEYQEMFRPLMPNITTLPFGDSSALESAIRKLGARNVAAVFLEPIQGEAGVIVPPPNFLREVNAICKRHDILIVADEIQTGLGRAGEWFSSAAGGLEPDIITLAKPLGGGMAAIGATIAPPKIIARTLGGFGKRHSNTFGGNSFSMAVGLKSLEILVSENLPARSKRLGARGLEALQTLQAKYPQTLEAVRGSGLLMALQFRTVIPPKAIPGLSDLISELSGGLGCRVLYTGGVTANFSLSAKRVIRLTPALTIPDETFNTMISRVAATMERNPTANHMLRHMPLDRLVRLGRVAFGL